MGERMCAGSDEIGWEEFPSLGKVFISQADQPTTGAE